MLTSTSIRQTGWFQFIPPQLQDLALVAFMLLERENELQSQPSSELTVGSSHRLTDYSFIVFPLSKVYEGFLKFYFFERGLINEETLKSKRFRIGRALNPDVSFHQQNEQWLYDDVAKSCSEEVAREIWNTWLDCRNRVFHFFPNHPEPMSLEKAGQQLERLANTMEMTQGCPRYYKG